MRFAGIATVAALSAVVGFTAAHAAPQQTLGRSFGNAGAQQVRVGHIEVVHDTGPRLRQVRCAGASVGTSCWIGTP